MSQMHEVTEACYPIHCHEHQVDEPGPGFLGCGECGHLYRTRGELRRAYRREFWRVSRTFHDPLWRRAWRVLTVREKHIYFCQHCIHDF